jgi:hypothetical protein
MIPINPPISRCKFKLPRKHLKYFNLLCYTYKKKENDMVYEEDPQVPEDTEVVVEEPQETSPEESQEAVCEESQETESEESWEESEEAPPTIELN